MRYLVKISYDGSKFYGFQRQNDKRSVQGDIELALSKIFNETILVKGAGRTDRGVHALGQCFHFDTKCVMKTQLLKEKLNENLTDIVVLKCKKVSEEFHSRFSVKKKHYSYLISFDKKDINSNYCYYHTPIDLKKMKKASKLFLGVHNFQNFVSGIRDDYTCIIYKINFKYRNNSLKIDFYGKSFYRYMVRNLVGALIDVGRGKATENDIIFLLNNKKTDKMLSTAPAKGLTLVKISY